MSQAKTQGNDDKVKISELEAEIARLVKARAQELIWMCDNAANLYNACLSGSPNKMQAAVCDANKNLKPGDLVFEQTSFFRPVRLFNSGEYSKALSLLEVGIGRLIDITREPMFPESEAEERGYKPGEKIPDETAYYIDCLAGHKFRWYNASFARIFEGSIFDLGSKP